MAPSDAGAASSPVPGNGVQAVRRLRSCRVPGQGRLRACLPGPAAAGARRLLRAVRPDVVHVQSHFQGGRGLLAGASAAGCPTVATNHFMPENMLQYARVPAVLTDRVSRWAWRDLARVHEPADVVTAPEPRAVELLGARAGLPGRAVFCMPGIAELQSLVMLEAMAAGRRVVAAEAVALPHLVHPGRNGLLYRPGDVAGLAAALADLLADPATRARMGAGGREAAAAHDLDAALDVFEDVASDVRGGAALVRVRRSVAGVV
ncbi:glycosyltransferase [Streptomyces sp. NPDC048845]|uniref:glycosyltransferase n=1 Tax=Streptomyces sp. NPDC048845 TaxID=3155390 RepID=UPI0034389012